MDKAVGSGGCACSIDFRRLKKTRFWSNSNANMGSCNLFCKPCGITRLCQCSRKNPSSSKEDGQEAERLCRQENIFQKVAVI